MFSQDDVLSTASNKGERLFDNYVACLPFLDRLRLEHLSKLIRTLKPPPQSVHDTTRCEFRGVPCREKSVGETPCCASRRCVTHLDVRFVCCCVIALTSKKPRSPEHVVRSSVEARCQMPTKPPKPRCQTCKTRLITCSNHMIPCSNPVFLACNFCSRFNCEIAECRTKICCDGVARRLTKFKQVVRSH